MEFIFHGTGTSSALPLVPCVTSTPLISDIKCRSCREAVASMTSPSDGELDEQEAARARVPGGYKNKRGNTGGILRKRGEDGVWRTIVIDVGKTFRDQATWLFRKHQIRRIDAVILTHGHADAIAGLDDLRAFTAPPSPQAGQVIPIYLSRATLKAVAQQFPYLVDKNQATGGGDVPSLVFRVFDDDEDEDSDEGMESGNEETGNKMSNGFDVHGIWVVPLPVHHGKYFTPPDQMQRLDAPQMQTQPSTPPQVIQPVTGGGSALAGNAIQPSLTSLLNRKLEESVRETVPFYCYGFVFDGKMVYLSDISYIPSKTWNTMVQAIQTPHSSTTDSSATAATNGSLEPPHAGDMIGPNKVPFPPSATSLPPNHLPCLILDTLRLEPHVSHLSFLQSLSIAHKLSPAATYLVGFTHPASHHEWEAACKEVQGIRAAGEEDAFVDAVAKSAVKQGQAMERVWEEVRTRWKGFVRPGYDGQVIQID